MEEKESDGKKGKRKSHGLIRSVPHSPLNKHRKKRVCAYCRISTDSEDQKHSLEAQVAYYSRLIGERNNWIFSGIYADEDRSGTKLNGRDEFQKMMQDCRRGQHDYIITKSVTRFARNTVDSIQAIRELKALGIGIYFEKERVDTLSEKKVNSFLLS